jgi:hypothetical protein
MSITPSTAQSLALQLLVPVLLLSFGVLALRVAPGPGTSARTAAWFMAGVTFAAQGAVATVHGALAVGAVLAGPKSELYALVVRLLPSGNDARSMVVLGFSLALAWVVLLGKPSPSRRAIVAAAVALMAAGFVAGLLEPPFDQRQGREHWSLLSYSNAATALVLFATLYWAMVRESIDWLLWVALALYAVQQALTSNIQMVLSWAGFGGGWAPAPRTMSWVGLVAAFIMLACTTRRLALARAGLEAPGLLERLRG